MSSDSAYVMKDLND